MSAPGAERSPRPTAKSRLGEPAPPAVSRNFITVDPYDVPAMTRELTRLRRDEMERQKLRAQGLIRARQFDWRHTAAARLDVYEHAGRRVRALCRSTVSLVRAMP